jgi:ABC-2 type transport system ATP-binding protein
VGLKGEEHKKYKEYSLGMKQKLGIAQVIMEDADLIILDEPFNGLDDKSAENMRNLIKKLKDKNKIIILSTHIKEDINTLIDVLYKVDDGQINYEKN